RLKIRTVLAVDKCPLVPSFVGNRQMDEVAYFRTEGPPAITKLQPPPSCPTPANFDSGLDNLTRYVVQTVPRTVPSEPLAKPLLPRRVYRGYDVGLAFNSNYVDQMYRSDGRDLSLILFDNNNAAARDSLGRLLTFGNRWGTATAISRSASEEEWITVLDGA